MIICIGKYSVVFVLVYISKRYPHTIKWLVGKV